jgi:arginine:agmatine antiporter
MVFWAFLGIEAAIVISARVKNPARDVPIGTLAGMAIAGVIYMAACAAIMGILPASVLAKSSAPFADATAPILGAAAAGAVALCAMLKASGTLASSTLMTLETAECESVLGQVQRAPVLAARASTPNLVFTGVLASLIVAASQSPTLARQFTIVTDVSVVLSVMVYGASSLALLRLSSALHGARRAGARVLAVCTALFSVTLIAASERDLLIWSTGAIVLAVLGYQAVWVRRRYMLKAVAEV